MSHTRKYGARAHSSLFLTMDYVFPSISVFSLHFRPNFHVLKVMRKKGRQTMRSILPELCLFLLSLSCNRHDANPSILHKTSARVGRRLDWVVRQRVQLARTCLMLLVIPHWLPLTRFYFLFEGSFILATLVCLDVCSLLSRARGVGGERAEKEPTLKNTRGFAHIQQVIDQKGYILNCAMSLYTLHFLYPLFCYTLVKTQ